MNMFASIAASGTANTADTAANTAASTPDSVAAGAQPESATGQNDLKSTAAQYSIGIDLGTTHCALSFVNKSASDGEKVVQGVLEVPQITAPASVQALP